MAGRMPAVACMLPVFTCLLSRGRAARVADLDVQNSMTFEDHVSGFLRPVLEGTWQTDYFSGDTVFIGSLAGEDAAYLHGVDKEREHYRAQSRAFTKGKGVRYLTIEKELPHTGKPGETLAVIVQRLDRSQSVHHRGRLFQEVVEAEPRWVLEWEHSTFISGKHKWWRSASNAAESLKGEQDEKWSSDRAQTLSLALMRQFDGECRLLVKSTEVLSYTTVVSFALSGGFGFGGLAATLSVQMSLDIDVVQRNANRLICIIEKMDDFASKYANSDGLGPQVAQGLSLLRAYSVLDNLPCFPSLGLSLSFNAVPYPPYIWPIPRLAFGIGWQKSVDGITECIKVPSMRQLIGDARNASSNDDVTKAVSVQGLMPAIAVDVAFAQGPSFAIFPPAIGWWWGMEASLAVNTRRLVKSLRASSCSGSACKSQCELDKEELFRATVSWTKAGRQLVKAKDKAQCATVSALLAEIQAEKGTSFDLENRPFTAVQHLEQLGSAAGRRSGTSHFQLGGGVAYVGSDGVSIGVYHNVDGPGASRDYQHECAEFEDFVNIYRKRVEPAVGDMARSCRPEEMIDVYTLPAMTYQSCSAVPLAGAPVWPSDGIDKNLSQCERCLQVTSYGMPCTFCVGFATSCRQFFFSSSWVPCISGTAGLPLEYFDGNKPAPSAREICLQARDAGWRGR